MAGCFSSYNTSLCSPSFNRAIIIVCIIYAKFYENDNKTILNFTLAQSVFVQLSCWYVLLCNTSGGYMAAVFRGRDFGDGWSWGVVGVEGGCPYPLCLSGLHQNSWFATIIVRTEVFRLITLATIRPRLFT